MIERTLERKLLRALSNMPVVALLGPRQAGKTTLALQVAENDIRKKSSYLDLELDTDLSKLDDAEGYLRGFDGRLLIIDEVQRRPDLFRLLRGLVDIRKRAGENSGQFLLLGSASRDLLQWRGDFVSTYLERDIPLMGPKVPAARMKRFWTMLAHYHGQQAGLSQIGKSLEVSHTTARSYLDILTDFYMVRQVQPWSGNTKKRLVKTPKIYLRDTGLLHRLLNIPDFETLLGHPVAGASWEGFVVENIVSCLSDKWQFSYYRTAAQAEIDLILEGPGKEVWAIEIKRSVAPVLSKSFHNACEDVKATRKFLVYSGTERFPLSGDTEAIGLIEMLKLVDKGNP